jgi:hypothetical protein
MRSNPAFFRVRRQLSNLARCLAIKGQIDFCVIMLIVNEGQVKREAAGKLPDWKIEQPETPREDEQKIMTHSF